jgi:thiamine pyrophosphate-dependent acetolactate synthase large subunit-like protein
VLQAHGVEFLFTLSGGHISPLLVGAKDRGIRIIDVRHEVNAVFAADAVSRLSNSIGVAAVTAGPGLTNTVTAVKNAEMAHSPLLLLGGATLGILKGRGSLQDIDQMALLRPHVKYARSVSRVCDIVPVLEEAIATALSGTPGPVFVELPLDVLYPEEKIREEFRRQLDGGKNPSISDRFLQWYTRRYFDSLFTPLAAERGSLPWKPAVNKASASIVNAAIGLLNGAVRPVVIMGQQTTTHESVKDIARAVMDLGAPIYLTSGARGLLGVKNPVQLRHKRSKALATADVVILLGVPNDFRMQYGMAIKKAKVVSINLDPSWVSRNRSPDHGECACPGDFVLRVTAAIGSSRAGAFAPWLAELKATDAARDAEIVQQAAAKADKYINPLAAVAAVEEAMSREDAIMVLDGGDFVGCAAYTIYPRAPVSTNCTWLDPGPFGTLGVGGGFALGAKLVRPEAEVWLIWGDGACGYSIMEYDTFVRHNVPIIAVVGNDAGWTQILRDQAKTFNDSVACVLEYSAYDAGAAALGGVGFSARTLDQLTSALAQAKKAASGDQAKPVLVNAFLGKTNFREGSISV